MEKNVEIIGFNDDVVISEHAYTRLKERNGWSRKTSDRMVNRVYHEGLRSDQVKGYAKRWIQNKAAYSGGQEDFIYYGEKLYVFKGLTMLTVLTVPAKGYLLSKAAMA